MNIKKHGLALALAATVGAGMASQASADVYGVGYINVYDLQVFFPNATGGQPGLYQFQVDAQASLNNNSSAGGANSCTATFPGIGTCGPAGAGNVLESPAQNAPGATNGVTRGDDDYTQYYNAGQYSNAESTIIDAVLVGDGATHATSISESNLQSVTVAASNTNVQSTTQISATFTIPEGQPADGVFQILFNADWFVSAEVSGGSMGLAQANSGLTVDLQSGGTPIVQWTPNAFGNPGCLGGLTCVAVEAGSLNNSASSDGAADTKQGTGFFSLNVSGLTSGTYTLAIASTTSNLVSLVPEVPVPGTLMLMGMGLLAGAGVSRRKKLA